jgi:hypothetical protein
MPPPRFVSRREFARLHGTSAKEVRRAVARGLPTRADGRIPVRKGSAWWSENHRPRMATPGLAPAASRQAQLYLRGCARKMLAGAELAKVNAELAELELRVRRRELIEVAPVRQRAFDVYRAARDRILAIPDRVSAQIAADKDPGQVRKLLLAELFSALEPVRADAERTGKDAEPPPRVH